MHRRAADDSSDVLRGGGAFDARSTTAIDYDEKARGDRYRVVRPAESDAWKVSERKCERYKSNDKSRLQTEGSMAADRSATHAEFPQHPIERRRAVQRPADSQTLKSNTKFEHTTTTSVAYKGGEGERAIARRPRSSNLLKSNAKFGGESVSAVDYTPKVGDRYPTIRARDSGALKNDGVLDVHTTAELDFDDKPRGERYESKRPVEDDAWRVSGGERRRVECFDRLRALLGRWCDGQRLIKSCRISRASD